jgi:hypothetical protein
MALWSSHQGRSAEYDELLARVSAAVNPADILEDIWVRDIVDLTWEAWRYRRLKAALMAISAHKALSAVLDPLMAGMRGKHLPQNGLGANRKPSRGLTRFSNPRI